MREIDLGGVKFAVEYRRFKGDHGPAIRVFGDVDGKEVQLLRFDCFDDDPHYHYDPQGKNQIFHLDPLTMGSPLDFSLQQIGRNLRAMIKKAGFPQAASTFKEEDVPRSVDEIRGAVQAEEAGE